MIAPPATITFYPSGLCNARCHQYDIVVHADGRAERIYLHGSTTRIRIPVTQAMQLLHDLRVASPLAQHTPRRCATDTSSISIEWNDDVMPRSGWACAFDRELGPVIDDIDTIRSDFSWP